MSAFPFTVHEADEFLTIVGTLARLTSVGLDSINIVCRVGRFPVARVIASGLSLSFQLVKPLRISGWQCLRNGLKIILRKFQLFFGPHMSFGNYND